MRRGRSVGAALSPVGAVAAGWVEYATGSIAAFATEMTRDGKAQWWRTYRHNGRGVLIRAIRLDYSGHTLVGRLPDTSEGFTAGLRYDGTYFWSRTVAEGSRDIDLLDPYYRNRKAGRRDSHGRNVCGRRRTAEHR